MKTALLHTKSLIVAQISSGRCAVAVLPRRNHRQRDLQAARRQVTAMASPGPSGEVFFLDSFAQRQWNDAADTGTFINYDQKEFVERVHQYFKQQGSKLVDGYAPFCKHVFVPNFVGAKVGIVEITEANEQLLRTGYVSRRPEEMAVLSRWFPVGSVPLHEAAYLDLILYSREQLIKEYEALPSKDKPAGGALPDAPWGIISIKAQDEGHETPMQPITVMRNALGREEGGSGVPIDKEAYRKSVEYWQNHAVVQ